MCLPLYERFESCGISVSLEARWIGLLEKRNLRRKIKRNLYFFVCLRHVKFSFSNFPLSKDQVSKKPFSQPLKLVWLTSPCLGSQRAGAKNILIAWYSSLG